VPDGRVMSSAYKSELALLRIRHFANKDLQASQRSAAVQRVVVSTAGTTGGSRIGERRESPARVTTAALADRADEVNCGGVRSEDGRSSDEHEDNGNRAGAR